MKKKISIALLICMIVLSACSRKGVFVVQAPPITDETEGHHYTINNLSLNDDKVKTLGIAGITFPIVHEINTKGLSLESVEYSLDYYINGKFNSTIASIRSSLDSTTEQVYLYALQNNINETETKWILNVEGISELSSGSGASIAMHTSPPYDRQTASYLNDIELKLNEEIILGYIGRNGNMLGDELSSNLVYNEQLFVIKCKLNELKI